MELNRETRSHEQHRVLSIRGKSYCNSACVFCVEKFTTQHPVAPKVDEIRQLIVAGAGKYNMLFFMNGEPSLLPKLFEYVALAKSHGFKYFGMSSHFRAFADPDFARRILEAGFEFFDISLHAATFKAQEEVNPIEDGGLSLKEALHGLRNIYEIARRTRRHIGVTHKIVVVADELPRPHVDLPGDLSAGRAQLHPPAGEGQRSRLRLERAPRHQRRRVHALRERVSSPDRGLRRGDQALRDEPDRRLRERGPRAGVEPHQARVREEEQARPGVAVRRSPDPHRPQPRAPPRPTG